MPFPRIWTLARAPFRKLEQTDIHTCFDWLQVINVEAHAAAKPRLLYAGSYWDPRGLCALLYPSVHPPHTGTTYHGKLVLAVLVHTCCTKIFKNLKIQNCKIDFKKITKEGDVIRPFSLFCRGIAGEYARPRTIFHE